MIDPIDSNTSSLVSHVREEDSEEDDISASYGCKVEIKEEEFDCGPASELLTGKPVIEGVDEEGDIKPIVSDFKQESDVFEEEFMWEDEMAEVMIKEEEADETSQSHLKQKADNAKSECKQGIYSDTVFKCLYCNEDFKTTSTLTSHTVQHHSKASIITNNDPQDRKYLKCSLCDYKDTKHSRLETHLLAKHTKQKLYQCSICQYKTAYANSLRDHKIAKHTTQRPHQCSYCEFKSVQATHLKRHIYAKHKLKKPHQCNICDYNTIYTSALKEHILVKHTEVIPQQCPNCDYKTVRPSLLKTHILKYHDKMNLQHCNECEYKTVLVSNLKRHILAKHTHDKAEQCTFCHYKAVRKDTLKRHILAKHPS